MIKDNKSKGGNSNSQLFYSEFICDYYVFVRFVVRKKKKKEKTAETNPHQNFAHGHQNKATAIS